jgi:hypothetical protein
MHRLLPALTAIILVLTGCAEPLPTDKRHYVGSWEAENMVMVIRPNGSLAYSRKEEDMQTTVNGPIKEFQGNNIVVGIGWFTTTFDVSLPPRIVNGDWVMEVDGVRLTRTGTFEMPADTRNPEAPANI